MTGYWIKIIAKAIGIFIVGMILITSVRKVKGGVSHALNSSDPIPIPLIGLVPFRLDSDKLGSLSRVEFLRSDPEHVSGVRVIVKLADSIPPGNLGRCQIALDDVDNLNEHTSFRCIESGASVAGLEPFGVVAIRNSTDSFPLLLPASAIARLRGTTFSFRHGKLDIKGPGDTIADQLAARTDSLRAELEARIEQQSDSIDQLRDLSTELEDSASDAPRDARRGLQRSADEVRGRMREMVDLMKADEGRLHSLQKLGQLRNMQGNWKPAEGARIADSVQEFVNNELARVQAELDKAGVGNVRVQLQFDSASAAAMREGMAPPRGRAASGRGSAAAGRGNPATTSVEAPATPATVKPPAKATPAPAPQPPEPR